MFCFSGIASGFLGSIAVDYLAGNLKNQEVKYAIELRNIVTSLGPAYIKLGQALSIRPDILSPAAMNELQKLCDKVLLVLEKFCSTNNLLLVQLLELKVLGCITLPLCAFLLQQIRVLHSDKRCWMML